MIAIQSCKIQSIVFFLNFILISNLNIDIKPSYTVQVINLYQVPITNIAFTTQNKLLLN